MPLPCGNSLRHPPPPHPPGPSLPAYATPPCDPFYLPPDPPASTRGPPDHARPALRPSPPPRQNPPGAHFHDRIGRTAEERPGLFRQTAHHPSTHLFVSRTTATLKCAIILSSFWTTTLKAPTSPRPSPPSGPRYRGPSARSSPRPHDTSTGGVSRPARPRPDTGHSPRIPATRTATPTRLAHPDPLTELSHRAPLPPAPPSLVLHTPPVMPPEPPGNHTPMRGYA